MFAILGLCIGSFINVVVYRLPKRMEQEWVADARDILEIPDPVNAGKDPAENLSRASACPSCDAPIQWWKLTPGLGWFFANGKCAICKTAISLRYPSVELLTGLVFALIAWRVGSHPVALAWAFFAASLITLTLIDADAMLLPDSIVMPLLWSGLLLAAFGQTPVTLFNSVVGAAAGYMILWCVCEGFRLVTGKVGMGNGDMKLLAVGGAWLGWEPLVAVLLASSVVGAAFGIYQRLSGKIEKGQAFPFGPFLAVAICGVAFWNYPK